MDKSRLTWIDMAKGYGIIAVMAGHLVQDSPLGLFVYSFHLPLFFFLSGYLFSLRDSFGQFIMKKLCSIVLPYFGLGILIVLCNLDYPFLFGQRNYYPGVLPPLVKEELLKFVRQIRYETLWYLGILLGVNLLMYFIAKLKNDILITFILIVLPILGYMNYKVLGNGSIYWNLDVVPMAIPFFGAGYLVKKHDILDRYQLTGKRKFILLPLFTVLCIGLNMATLMVSGSGLEMYRITYGQPVLTYASAFCGIVMILELSSMFSAKPLLYIGENSLIFFLWHQAVIYPLVNALYDMAGLPGTGDSQAAFWGVLTTKILISCLALWGLNEIVKRTPIRVFTGR